MDITFLETREDYEKALQRLEVIFDAKLGTEEGNELELLSMLIDKFEKEMYPIDTPDPTNA